jgi:formyltetrahydrofolate synthetase
VDYRLLCPGPAEYHHRPGGSKDGFMMDSGFAIAVSSEVMAILAVAKDLKRYAGAHG